MDDEYEKKFAEMQKYIPFLEAMIERLQKVKDSSGPQNIKDKETNRFQLQKMQSLHGILTNSKRKLKIETLQRCEDVLEKLQNKVEKGHISSSQMASTENNDIAQPTTSSPRSSPEDGQVDESKEMDTTENLQDVDTDKEITEIEDETPASPDRTRSPSPDCQILPIIIPTERASNLPKNKCSNNQRSRSKVIPVITITDRSDPLTDSNSDDVTTEWDMLEESERLRARSRNNQEIAPGHDVTPGAKPGTSNLSQSVNDGRNYPLDSDDVQTIPVPSLDGSRRLTSYLKKLNLSRTGGETSELSANIPDGRHNSPDPEILFTRSRVTSSTDRIVHRSKDTASKSPSKAPSIPLLLSPPPPASNEPPLSQEDLAELLCEESGAERNDKTDKSKHSSDKHTSYRLTVKKNLQNTGPGGKAGENKGPPPHQMNDQRSQTFYQRYASNYERYPRQCDGLEEGPHGVSSAPSDRNVPLYQRRRNTMEGHKDTTLTENEFVIEGMDYYNMHMNQMHWPSPANTQEQFSNAQWRVTNPTMQHPVQHPYPMDPSQFRPNPYSSNLQYPSYPMSQGSFAADPYIVERPPEYPPMRPTWEGNVPRVGENAIPYENVIPCGIVPDGSSAASFQRPSTVAWGRSNRGRGGRDGYYNDRNRAEGNRPGFSRDARRPDWSRDGQSNNNREHLSRFPNRDPRVRAEHNATASPSQAKESSTSPRDPRIAKEKHASAPNKAKDVVAPKEKDPSEKDPRKRQQSTTLPTKTPAKEKSKHQKSPEKEREKDKLLRDKMLASLEGIYGVIDTTTQGSSLQKFRIPKIKRPEQSQSVNHVANETRRDKSSPRAKTDGKKKRSSFPQNTSKDGASTEVSSSSDSNLINDVLRPKEDDTVKENDNLSSSLVEESDRNSVKIIEADTVTNNAGLNDAGKSKKDDSEADGAKSKDGFTQEWIEQLIRKSFEFGEGKKIIEHAKLITKLGEVLEKKKLKKIKKIIDSDSVSSSDEDEVAETKKTRAKKKRRVIVSDSSDDDSLVEKFETLNSSGEASGKRTKSASAASAKSKRSRERVRKTTAASDPSKEGPSADVTAKGNTEGNNDAGKGKDAQTQKRSRKETDPLEDDNKKTNDQSESNEQTDGQSLDKEKEDKDKENTKDKDNKIDQISAEKASKEQSSGQDNDAADPVTRVDEHAEEAPIDKVDKPKPKTKRRNSLEMLHEDIKEMFISDDVVTATGYRMCRLSKENQSGTNASLKRDEASNSAERKAAESSAVENDVKSGKPSKSRKGNDNTTRSRARIKRNVKRKIGARSKEYITSSDSEEETPLALRADKSLGGASVQGDSERLNDELRRSRRVTRKDVANAPRVVVEKVDVARADSSKTMFDTSSDESFGIDVDELTAAVDSSLRREKQSEDAVEQKSAKCQKAARSKRQSKSARKAALLTDDRSEDELSCTDADSVLSDTSMLSNKVGKGTGGAARTCTREELLCNMLMGLVPLATEKDASSADKNSEMNVNESTNDSVETKTKKLAGKKKKKKSSWKMGIVSTKKKKKKATASNAAQTDSEKTSNETNVPMDAAEESSLKIERNMPTEEALEEITGDCSVDDANTPPLVTKYEKIEPPLDSIDIAENYKEFDNFTELSDPPNVDCGEPASLNDSFVSVDETKPMIKMEVDVAEEDVRTESSAPSTVAATVTASVTTAPGEPVVAATATAESAPTPEFIGLPASKSSSEIIYDEQVEEVLRRMDTKDLIEYAWTGRQDRYKCQLCIFVGKTIVYHYKMSHPGREILISRLRSIDAEAAIADGGSGAAAIAATTETDETDPRCKFRCRFCYFISEGAEDVALEAFYEHCTTHTGEYRFHCNSCSYQAVAKTSLKTHFYKVCRKQKETFNDAYSEDEVPKEDSVYGYLCRACNYVQLKRQNVEAHVAFWHRDNPSEITKINMSVTIEESDAVSEKSQELDEDEIMDVKPQIPQLRDSTDSKDAPELIAAKMNDTTVSENGTQLEPQEEMDVQIKEEVADKPREFSSQEEPESTSLSTDNLSVFVCPPELENNEVEIQRKRQKMMQEIANNILLKNYPKPGLSIIDKLQDKMRPDAAVGAVPEGDSSAGVTQPEDCSILASSMESSSLESNVIIKEDLNIEESCDQEENILPAVEQSATDELEAANDAEGKVDVKIRDPLLIIMDSGKSNESDDEHAAVFESDSSSEQSDTDEPPADVDTILKETTNMNASSTQDPMLNTTIQRLAAQLQNTKPSVPEPMPDIKVEIESEYLSTFQEAPNVVPIDDVRNAIATEGSAECSRAPKATSTPRKNFITFRRLSGDKLSVSTPALDNKVADAQVSDEPQSGNSQQAETDEECSFLKIENVVSLAPKSDNKIENLITIAPKSDKKPEGSPVIGNIRMVEISSMKNKCVLKKPPLILKKPSHSVFRKAEYAKLIPIKNPSTSPEKSFVTPLTDFVSIAPVTVTKASPSKVNYMVVSMSPIVQKVKDIVKPTTKLKSESAYVTMLTEKKLCHFYKCMAYDCDYTTDYLDEFRVHYQQHEENEKASKETADYQACPYCYMTFSTWVDIELHLWEKHSHCQYQCAYCFYRAISPSYMQQHQSSSHPGKKFQLLLGKMLKSVQKQESIDRKTYVLPFVCTIMDCNTFYYVFDSYVLHLKTKHLIDHPICHVCNTHMEVDALITHYTSHGYAKYQCLYCLHGTNSLRKLHQHLSTFHYNRLPHFLERSLPTKMVSDAAIIDQLIMRNFGIIKIEGNVTSNDANTERDSPAMDLINTQISSTSLSRDTASPSQERSNLQDIPASNHDSGVSSSTEINTDRTVSSKESKDAPLSGVASASAENLLSSVNDFGATNTSKSSVDPTCGDEFVNTNLLDDSKILESLAASTDDTSVPKNDIVTSTRKSEDSDIEILEDTESEKDSGAPRKTKDPKADDACRAADSGSAERKIERKDESASRDTASEEKLVTSEESSSSAVSAAVTASARIEKPLTLNDIRQTGLTGCDLYKCAYSVCKFAAPSADVLKVHVKDCNVDKSNRTLHCKHCKRHFGKIGFFMEHIKIHGLKRFGCSQCHMRFAVGYQATSHMRIKHKSANTKLIPADPTNPSVDGLFVVHSCVSFSLASDSAERKPKKRKGVKLVADNEGEKIDNEKLSFNPDEISQLPRQAIYNREVQCAVCPYTTKVRTNIIRHLQLHAKDERVPESGPVNPVPCLDKKEKMFDKMVNLASSSHQNGRMGGNKPKATVTEDDTIPKFVPEHKRYVCAECNYLTVDEGMLRYHLKALHTDEQYFRCPHCPVPTPGQENQSVSMDKMGVHLKMHDTRLYKCSHCNYHHYHRYVVERHLTDKHSEKRPFVKVIRELENVDNVQQQPVQEEPEEEVPDPDGNHWKCNLCDFKCVYKADASAHADTVHGESCQYKCTLCKFKTNGKIILEQHINSKHAYDCNADYTVTYHRIRGVNKRNTEGAEQSGQDEPFDTTPIWSRNMPRVRHIRGILLEEEIEATAEASPATTKTSSLGKRKSDTEISAKPAKVRLSEKSGSLDDSTKHSKEKLKRSHSCEKLSREDSGNEGQAERGSAQSKIDSRDVAEKRSAEHARELDAAREASDVGRFGPYGKPDGNMYVCTLCNHFKTKYKHDMRDHLYRELNYSRWHCKACGYVTVNRNALMQHFHKRHHRGDSEPEPLSPDNAIEDWVMTLLKKQTDMIKRNANVTYKNVPVSVNKSGESNAVTCKKSQTDKKAVNLAPTISNLKTDILQDVKSIDTDDGDSRDDDLVIDMGEDEECESRNENEPENVCEKTETPDKTLVCKHCKIAFHGLRGLKLHIVRVHLKGDYSCPYCNHSTCSELAIRQHIRVKHPLCPEKIIHRPNTEKQSNEFWEKQYGVTFPAKARKRKKLSVEESVNRTSVRVKCEICGFMAINYTGLKSHMRTHGLRAHTRDFKCEHCTYKASFKAELLEHWELNHPEIPFKFQESFSAAESSSGEMESETLSPEKQRGNVYDTSEDVEDEPMEESLVPVNNSNVIYSCSYCSLRSNSLLSIKRHWSIVHKDSKSSEVGDTPFKYKEIRLPASLPGKDAVPESSSEIGKPSPSMVQRHGWVCQWCREFCKTDNDRVMHQNIYHSHLPQNFKWQKQQQKEQDQLTNFSISARQMGKTEGIPSYESVVENLVANQARCSMNNAAAEEMSSFATSLPRKSDTGGRKAVARKSTARSTLSYVRPGPRVFKAVARKSTNPLPRYLPNYVPMPRCFKTIRDEEETRSELSSYYGIPSKPVNLAELNTYMVVGGHSMRVNCQTLATLININPKILLKDIRKDPKYSAILSDFD